MFYVCTRRQPYDGKEIQTLLQTVWESHVAVSTTSQIKANTYICVCVA